MAIALILKIGILAIGAYWIWSRTQGDRVGSEAGAVKSAPVATRSTGGGSIKVRRAARFWTAAQVCLILGIVGEVTYGIADPIVPGSTWAKVFEIGGYFCLGGAAIFAAASGWTSS